MFFTVKCILYIYTFWEVFYMKKLKITSSILATSLIITPISSILNQNDNIVKATNNTINAKANANKKIKKIDTLSTEETKKLIDKLYQEKLIKPEKYKELQAMFQSRSFWGKVYVVTFWDNAKDIHIPGWLFSSMAAFTLASLTKVLVQVTIAYPAAAAIMRGPYATSMRTLGGIAIANFTWNAMKNGLVLYYKPVYYKNRPYTHKFSHMRIDY